MIGETPVVSLARIAFLSCDFDEALVEGEIVTNGVLPALLVVAIVGKIVHDVLIDSAQRALLLRRLSNCHCNERDVGVGWFLQRLRRPCRLGSARDRVNGTRLGVQANERLVRRFGDGEKFRHPSQ